MGRSKNKEYAMRLKELEGYERDIIAFKVVDEIPKGIEYYGDDVSFMCGIVNEVWQGRKCFIHNQQKCAVRWRGVSRDRE